MPPTRLFWLVAITLVITSGLLIEIDRVSLHRQVRETLNLERSLPTEEDRIWWTRHVGPLPADDAEEISAIPVGITGGPALDGNMFHFDGGDGADGADGIAWNGPSSNFEACELRAADGTIAGRVLVSATTWGYRLDRSSPWLSFERFAVVPAGVDPGNPVESDQWSSRPKYATLAGANVLAVGFVLGAARLLTGWSAARRNRRLASRAAADETAPIEPIPGVSEGACPRCGFELAISTAGKCSECGATAGALGRRARLLDADPRWLWRVALGRRLLSLSLHGIFAALVLWLVVFPFGFYVSHALSDLLVRYADFLDILIAGSVIVAVVGAFLLSRMDPRETNKPRRWSPRRLARMSLLAAAVVYVAPFILFRVFTPIFGLASGLSISVLLAAFTALALLGCLGVLAECAQRLPAPALARLCRRRRLVFVLAAALALVVDVAIALTLPNAVNYFTNLSPAAMAITLNVVLNIPILLALASCLGPLRAVGRAWDDERQFTD